MGRFLVMCTGAPRVCNALWRVECIVMTVEFSDGILGDCIGAMMVFYKQWVPRSEMHKVVCMHE